MTPSFEYFDDPAYIERRKRAVKRRLRLDGIEALDGLDGLIARAMQGESHPLAAYVRSNRLRSEERELLAWFIETRAHRKRGRPRGTRSRGEHADAVRDAIVEIEKRRALWRQRARRVRVDATVTKLIIERVMAERAPMLDGEFYRLRNAVTRKRRG